MKKGTIVLLSILGVIALFVMSMVGSYNNLVSYRENVESQLSQIDNQLQRRNDLIPNLVSTVKGYAKHEKEIFEEVSNARSRLLSAGTVKEKSEADGELSQALGRLLAISESYPELKANENFIRLQDELAGTENRIAVARRDYNESAKGYNIKIAKFPAVILANMFGFDKYEYFKAEEKVKEVPKVEF
ncbi:MAG: LemA family protein [Fusobacteriaceae bacterium]|nr:LemA family protein [Fusobacteriaceae bacterium]MBN2838685.1 LemA family protein [Fusobacteriaceae bacterium]